MRDVDGEWQLKGVCDLTLDDLAAHAEGVQLILVPPEDLTDFTNKIMRLSRKLRTLRHVAASYLYRGDDRARINALDRMAARAGLGILATNEVLYHVPQRRPLQDVMTCIREKVCLDEAGFLLEPNAERYLKSPTEMARLFAEWPNALAASREVAMPASFP
jgi:error-prone DNA polymerase